MNAFQFNTTPGIRFGPGRVREMGAMVRAMGAGRVLFVTDAGVMQAGLAGAALDSLGMAGCTVKLFDQVRADPPVATILDAAATAREFGADVVVGFGGGSSMDTAKLAALLARSQEPLAEIFGVGLAKGPRLPLLLAPTTAGTGSEVTPIAIVTTASHEKKGVVSPLLLPDAALLDPSLTLGLPPGPTAMTGIDAMVHAIEAHASVNPNNNPISRMLATEALRLLGRNLLTAVRDGANPAARSAMLLGAALAGQAFANSPVAAVHALAYPLGGHYQVPHGLANSLVLPGVLRFNAATAADCYTETACAAFPELGGFAAGQRATAFADRLEKLAADCALPVRLRDVGVERSLLPRLAADAMQQTRLLVNNPRELNESDALAIYAGAW